MPEPLGSATPTITTALSSPAMLNVFSWNLRSTRHTNGYAPGVADSTAHTPAPPPHRLRPPPFLFPAPLPPPPPPPPGRPDRASRAVLFAILDSSGDSRPAPNQPGAGFGHPGRIARPPSTHVRWWFVFSR